MSVAQAEAAARELRHVLGSSESEPIDILKVAHQVGALVALSPIDGGPQGMFALRGSEAWIYVNTAGARPPLLGRLRFTIAHELGHWRLGHGGGLDHHIQLYGASGHEADANAFAAELLIPERALNQLRGEARAIIDLDLVVEIASRYGVSCPFVIYRLATVGAIKTAAKRKLREACDRGEHLRGEGRQRQSEYVDLLAYKMHEAGEVEANVMPTELIRRVEDLWEHGVIDDEAAAAHARTTAAAFRKRMRRIGVEPATSDVADGDWW